MRRGCEENLLAPSQWALLLLHTRATIYTISHGGSGGAGT
jgi:hypothetical protein